MNFETLLFRVILVAALVLVACLVAIYVERRRRPSIFSSPAFRSAHVQPTQKPEPTVATVRRSKNPLREWERQTNSGMY